MTDLPSILEALSSGGVEFVLIGGMAGVAHGSSRVTVDIDVVYRRSNENMERLAATLAPHAPTLRGAPPGLPFRFDPATIRAGLNFTLDRLIALKRACGRPKDLEVVAELEALRQARAS